NEFTMSAVCTPRIIPDQSETNEMFSLQNGQPNGVLMGINRRPATFPDEIYFSWRISARPGTDINTTLIASGTHEFRIDNPSWLVTHWYWMAVSYNFSTNTVKTWVRNLSLETETTKSATVSNLIPVEWNDQLDSASVCSWGVSSDDGRTEWDGYLSQGVIHNKY
ncbi:unnamed protein product, partial [marine sediment metagenome]